MICFSYWLSNSKNKHHFYISVNIRVCIHVCVITLSYFRSDCLIFLQLQRSPTHQFSFSERLEGWQIEHMQRSSGSYDLVIIVTSCSYNTNFNWFVLTLKLNKLLMKPIQAWVSKILWYLFTVKMIITKKLILINYMYIYVYTRWNFPCM